jgi:hypothetical protein
MRQTLDRVMVFGARVHKREDGSIELGRIAKARADKAVKHYYDYVNPRDPNAFMLFAGGRAGYLEQDLGISEADAMAYYAIHRGVLEALVQKEEGSRSTLGNLRDSMRMYGDILDPEGYTPDYPLTLVSGRHHLARIVFLAEKLGFDPAALHPVPSDEVCDVAFEQATLEAYRQAFGEFDDDLGQQALIEQRVVQLRAQLLASCDR